MTYSMSCVNVLRSRPSEVCDWLGFVDL